MKLCNEVCINHAGILQVGIFIKIYLKNIVSVKIHQDTVSEIWKALSYKMSTWVWKISLQIAFYRQH